MKEIVKTSRLAGSLEKLFRLLNEDFFNQVNQLPGHMRMAGRYSDRLQGAVWEMVNAYVQAAILYGYHIAQVLQEAARSPQELAAYMRDTTGGGEAV